MTPPLSTDERQMFTEIMTQIRHSHDELYGALNRLDDKLSQHVAQEDGQYDELNERISSLREDVATLKTRWGILASAAAIVGGAVMAGIQKVFF